MSLIQPRPERKWDRNHMKNTTAKAGGHRQRRTRPTGPKASESRPRRKVAEEYPMARQTVWLVAAMTANWLSCSLVTRDRPSPPPVAPPAADKPWRRSTWRP